MTKKKGATAQKKTTTAPKDNSTFSLNGILIVQFKQDGAEADITWVPENSSQSAARDHRVFQDTADKSIDDFVNAVRQCVDVEGHPIPDCLVNNLALLPK